MMVMPLDLVAGCGIIIVVRCCGQSSFFLVCLLFVYEHCSLFFSQAASVSERVETPHVETQLESQW